MAHLDQVGGVALRLVAEAKVVSLVDFDGVKTVAQHRGDEGLSGHFAEFVGEGKDEHGVDSRGLKQVEAFGHGGDELGRSLGPKDARRVRIEGDRDGLCSEFSRAVLDLRQQPLVAAMDSVEVADAGDGGAEVCGDLVEVAKDVHGSNLEWG